MKFSVIGSWLAMAAIPSVAVSVAIPTVTVIVEEKIVPGEAVRYKINLDEVTGGKFSVQIKGKQTNASQALACEGDTVTIVPTPESGYKVKNVTLGNEILPYPYTFTMPANEVSVSGTFESVATVVVTFDVNGGSLASGSLTETITSGLQFKNINKPIVKGPTGCVFKEWCYDKEGTQPVGLNDQITSNKTIYASYGEGKEFVEYGYYTKNSSGNRLLYFSQTIFSFDPDQRIWAVNIDDPSGKYEPQYWDRATFNQEVIIGSEVTHINDDFLNACPSFDHKITFPSKLEEVGQDFLFNCTAFNNGGTDDLDFSNVTTNFVIDGEFMYGCTGFNKKVTIPLKCTEVGEQFMYNCSSFTNLVVQNDVSNWISTGLEGTLCALSSSASMYNPGVKVSGLTTEQFTAFTTKFPKLEGGQQNFWRYLHQ